MRLEILSNFRGYPDDKTERRFVKGQIIDNLPEIFGDVLIGKGLAQKKDAAPSPAAPAAPLAAK